MLRQGQKPVNEPNSTQRNSAETLAAERLLFHFPEGRKEAGGTPLACMNGALILDSGEEDPSFVFRCQDRFLTYTSLLGLRSLFLVLDDRHAALYHEAIAKLRRAAETLASFTGVLTDLSVPEPLYVGCSLPDLRLSACGITLRQLAEAPGLGQLFTNQISPTFARLFAELAGLAQTAGQAPPWDLDAWRRMGEIGLGYHDKSSYVSLVTELAVDAAPRHVETLVVPWDELLAARDWRALQDLVAALPRLHEAPALHLKSALDSGGNVAAAGVERGNAAAKLAALAAAAAQSTAADADAYRQQLDQITKLVSDNWISGPLDLARPVVTACLEHRLRARRAHQLAFLVQRRLMPPLGHERPRAIGCSSFIASAERSVPIVIAEQVYIDDERRRHVGSHVVEGWRQHFADLEPGLTDLCRLFASRGYRGPISFDACLDAEGCYQLIYDCNPRLTAVFASLVVQRALRQRGLAAPSVTNLDYHGRYVYPDLEQTLRRLDQQDLLYKYERQRGVLLLPNLARRDGYDALLIGLQPADTERLVASGALGATAGTDKGRIESLYT